MMNSIDAPIAVWVSHGWLALLAFTVAVLVVAVLREPCRRLFGTERAFQLWLLPPLAVLVSQLPHAAVAERTTLPALVYAITSAGASLPVADAGVAEFNWRGGLALVWFAGVALMVMLGLFAQWRYRQHLSGATKLLVPSSRWPVLLAADASVGPAVVGAWRFRIVLPSDFERRYDRVEQELILAHEMAHARRRDGCWCLLAQCLAAAFWFHPLSWWALAAFRQDQELACDASVLRQHGKQRRAYAQAMLKTPSAMLALPVGCSWSPRHPLTERIAMLKLPRPDPRRQMCGVATMLLLALAVSGLAFAASQPAPQASSSGPAAPNQRYTLKLALGVDGQPARLHATSCLKPGEYYTDTQTAIGTLPPWHGRYTVVPGERGMLEVQAHLSGGSLPAPVDPRVRTRPGQTATIQVGQQVAGKDGNVVEDHTIRIELTPNVGC
jgi:beta-lactamase regulating signal transducer with metallopeptidase domain